MNSVHDSKDWHTMPQAPLQSPTVAVDPLSSPKSSNGSNGYAAPNNNEYNPNNTPNAYSQDISL